MGRSSRKAGQKLRPWRPPPLGSSQVGGKLEPLPRLQGEDAVPKEIGRVAWAVRAVLHEAFPDRPGLFRQCKRAAVMLDQLLGKRGIHVILRAGQIATPGQSPHNIREHVWCRLNHPNNRRSYLLDVTLTQFSDLLRRPVPEVVWGEYRQTLHRYGYVEDGLGNWYYDPRDFDPARVRAAEALLEGSAPNAAAALSFAAMSRVG